MKTPEKVSPVMEFVFQTIKLEQVPALIPVTYRSKYEAIRNQVIERIKSMPEGETFIFQPQDKKTKLDDNLIARICHGINVGLVKENLAWKISFSNKARAFVVAPYKRYKLGKRGEYKVTQPDAPKTNKVTRVIDRASHMTKIPKRMTPEEVRQIDHLLSVTHQKFGKSLKDLQTKIHGGSQPELSNVRKAFLYVGRNALGVKLSHLGTLLGMNSSSSTIQCQQAIKDPKVQEYVKKFAEAINQNGGGN